MWRQEIFLLLLINIIHLLSVVNGKIQLHTSFILDRKTYMTVMMTMTKKSTSTVLVSLSTVPTVTNFVLVEINPQFTTLDVSTFCLSRPARSLAQSMFTVLLHDSASLSILYLNKSSDTAAFTVSLK